MTKLEERASKLTTYEELEAFKAELRKRVEHGKRLEAIKKLPFDQAKEELAKLLDEIDYDLH